MFVSICNFNIILNYGAVFTVSRIQKMDLTTKPQKHEIVHKKDQTNIKAVDFVIFLYYSLFHHDNLLLLDF